MLNKKTRFLVDLQLFATAAQTMTAAAGGNQITQVNGEVYNRTLLERLKPELMLTTYGEPSMSSPKNAGDTQSWRRYNSLATATTPLVEGVTPEGVNGSVTKVSATVNQYGNYLVTSDRMTLTALDPTITEFSEIMGENAGESIENIVRDIVAGGSNVAYAGTKLTRDTIASTDKITALDILKLRRNLKRSKVKKIKLPNGRMGYLAFIHTDVATDLMQTQEWKDQNTYVDTKNRENGEIGQMYGIYFLEYDLAPKFTGQGAGGTVDVYAMLVIGKGAFGVPDVAGSSKPKIIVKLAQNSGTEDALEQRNTVGWKALFTGVRLQELAIVRYECAATV